MIRLSSAAFRKKYVRESAENSAIVDYLQRLGGVVLRLQSGEIFQRYTLKRGPKKGEEKTYRIKLCDTGTPDYICYFPQRKNPYRPVMFFFWEGKRPGGIIRDAQREFIDRARSHGVPAGYGGLTECQAEIRRWGITR